MSHSKKASKKVDTCNVDACNVDTRNTDTCSDEFEQYCPSGNSLYPKGIERVTDTALGSMRLIMNLPKGTPEKPIQIAVFDFDGTCISGSSPKKLVRVLGTKGRISLYKLFRVGLWGLAYKLNLPKDAEGVRARVFSAFEGKPAQEVNDFLCNFYHERVEPLYRQEADAAMFAHLEAGHVIVLVSASFEPIIASAMVEHPIQFALASRMKIIDGCYTNEVDGPVTEGPDKLDVFTSFANEQFGEGCWEVGWAYADHYSDLDLLSSAKHPCPVTPDWKLKDYASKKGWEILDWE